MQHRSFWLSETLGDAPDEPPLHGAARADVAIVGGGLVGLWTAIRIKERDPACDVVVLEQDICGGGASGRNGGEVLSWWAKAGKLVDLCGREEGVRIAQASVDAIGELEAFCTAHGIDAEFHRGGYLWTATTAAQLGAWDSTVELLRELGAPALELLEPEEVARRTGSPVHLAGVLDPSAATVQPAKLTRGLRRVALEVGVRIHEHTRVTHLDRRSPAVLRTPAGAISADRVVLATNAWAASLRELHTRLVVITSDIILTEEAPERLAEIGWTGYEAISDSQVMIHYYRRTPQGRVMFGKGGWGIALAGRLPASFDRHEGRARDVEANFRRIYPNLAGVRVEYDWCGPIDRSYHGLPIFGRLGGHEHLIYGVGWSGNGVGPSLLGGRILASLALAERDEWSTSPFVGERAGRFPPDPVRYTGAHVVRSAVVRMERAYAAGRDPRPWDTFLAGFAPAGIIPKTTRRADG
jgi:putative aminophosphonate oxidoreductase